MSMSRTSWPWLVSGFLGAASALSGAEPGGVRVNASTVPEVREWDSRIEQLARQGSLRLDRSEEDTMLPGRRHQRLAQFHKGVKVEGGQLVRQVGETGEVLSVFGTFFEGIALDVTPTITAAAARGAVAAKLGSEAAILTDPELTVVSLEKDAYVLAWTLVAGAGQDVRRYSVDARDGQLVRDYSVIWSQAAAVGRGTGVLNNAQKMSVASSGGQFVAIDVLRPARITTYDMKGNVFRADAALDALFNGVSPPSSDIGADADNVWTDGPTVDGHSYAGWTYDYFFKRFGRRGWNNGDLPIPQFVNPARPQDIFLYYGQFPFFFDNAFYCCFGVPNVSFMAYGVGAPAGVFTSGQIKSLAGSLEVVAHEITHGVSDFSNGLGATCESGGLNESFSDQMGVSAEFYQRPSTANYRLGEDVWPNGIRDMGNPALFGDPDHVSVATICEVHYLAGVPNQAFYLAIEGGRNRTSGITVQGVGAASREQIERVFYRAFTLKLVPSSGFVDAANATIVSARELFGANSAAERAVTQAWQAVGVLR
jgi:bacillolysin/thermolysin